MKMTVFIAKGWFGRWRLYARSNRQYKWLGTFPSPQMARHAQMGFVIEARKKGVTCITI